jgi:hypothetical protein
MIRRHKGDTKAFDELSYSEQAKAINALVLNLQRSITAHLRKADDEDRDCQTARAKCLSVVERMLRRMRGSS